jgi:imidazolonepropionase-like amidohydrolase
VQAATRQPRSADDARAIVRALASGGVDLIKIVFDSGRMGSRFGRVPRLDGEILRAAVAAAREAHLPVTVHWGNVEELPELIAAGPTQLEHAGYAPIPASLADQIASARIVVDPTLTVLSAILKPEEFASGPQLNVRQLHRAGVVITAGTDAPLYNLALGESLHRELELLVEAGLSPMEALQAATSRPAGLLQRAGEIGTIEVGKRADLIAVSGDPLRAIGNTRRVRLVIRDGRVVESSWP